MTEEVVPIREFLELKIDGEVKVLVARIDGLDKATTLAMDNAKTAGDKADKAFEERMDNTNEWRGALDDQSEKLATIESVDALKAQIERLEKKIEAKEVVGAAMLRLWAMTGGVITVIGIMVGIVLAIRGMF